jgi:hypothetical protein
MTQVRGYSRAGNRHPTKGLVAGRVLRGGGGRPPLLMNAAYIDDAEYIGDGGKFQLARATVPIVREAPPPPAPPKLEQPTPAPPLLLTKQSCLFARVPARSLRTARGC